ncbi:MAG: hypothetical protein IEMM0008_1396 [bacterium]|nr:MAG: hypothetical protein IEMM0008_1396 [bacterium]
MKLLKTLIISLAVIVSVSTVNAIETGSIGIRGGIGTDVNLGLAFGGGINYKIPLGRDSLEVGAVFFGASFDETTTEYSNTYNETTDVYVFGVMANYLFGYNPKEVNVFFLAGIGLAIIKVKWVESSPTDTSLGTPLAGGGSQQSAEGTTAGVLTNIGIGLTLSKGFDIRAEVPIIIIPGPAGGANAVIPTFMLTAGYSF